MEEHAPVLTPPPLLFLGAWAAASLLHRLVPLSVLRDHVTARQMAGGAAAAAAVCLSASVVGRFASAWTPVSPLRATRALVTGGAAPIQSKSRLLLAG